MQRIFQKIFRKLVCSTDFLTLHLRKNRHERAIAFYTFVEKEKLYSISNYFNNEAVACVFCAFMFKNLPINGSENFLLLSRIDIFPLTLS